MCISRAAGTCDFPSRFMFVAAMNPCPCGYAGDPKRECRCSSRKVMEYRNRVSGPLLDRIDIQIEVPPVPCEQLADMPPGEPSSVMRARVVRAREIQYRRFEGVDGVRCNAEIPSRKLMQFCRLDAAAQTRLRSILLDLGLSARAFDRVLKVSRTIADLAGSETVSEEHVFEASTYRTLDRSYWS